MNAGENVALYCKLCAGKYRGNYVKWPSKLSRALEYHDAVRVYFEPPIQLLKVRENLDHLKINKEKEMRGREILDYIIFRQASYFGYDT